MKNSIDPDNISNCGERGVFEGPIDQSIADHARYLLANSLVSANDTVLDCACGSGYGSNHLANRAKHVIGIDISKDAINYAKNKYHSKKVDYVLGDARKLAGIPDASIDVYISFETIEHFTETDEYLKRAYEVLKPGAFLLLSTPNAKMGNRNAHHLRVFKYDELCNVLQEHHFAIKKVYGQDPIRIGQRIRRFLQPILSKIPLRYRQEVGERAKIGIENNTIVPVTGRAIRNYNTFVILARIIK